MTNALQRRVEVNLGASVHPSVGAFAKKLAVQECAEAALFYGSNLRTGELEGVLDFYLLKPGPQQERIWPRVGYHEWTYDGIELRAKVAVMSAEAFLKAAAGELKDTTIWARFVQPSALVWCSGEQSRQRIVQSVCAAAETASRLAVALGPETGIEDEYWRSLFQATYKAEFRVEKSGREDSILSLNRHHFTGLLSSALAAQKIEFSETGGIIEPKMPDKQKQGIQRWWRSRQRLGKPLNVIRLIKASTTFDGAARYAAWKVERHTGVPVELTPWREKHPILAAPGVLFKIWRARRRSSGLKG
ncbi:hypothetical protein GCM10023115_05510 [Pontixanthobacter gangjinensis]|uniref:Uncharacterized protein n=1 Tax=Pontixanthobacter gangjinensis TaxID=1028742 RepID=A0A6I4SLZ6_9SPHN|nr:hypothetical protein [Pontixanthobacter gangjinensis]MXO55802.1 hypothetical protein [Pontixanthobacter gangjinensis]